MNTLHDFADWYIRLPASHAAILGMLFFFAVFIAFGALDSHFDPRKREIRMIKRRRRRDRLIRISAEELARHREDIDVRVSRGFQRAFRETHEVQR